MDNILPVEKNKKYLVKIHDIGSAGEGIGKINGFTVFVQGTLPSEEAEILVIKVKKNFAFGKLLRLISRSPYRNKPECEFYSRCGGCQLMHMKYEAQLDFKEKRVKDCLERIGRIDNPKVLPIAGMKEPFYYRNKGQFPVEKDKAGLKIGFYSVGSHKVADIDKCIIQSRASEAVFQTVKDFLKEKNISIYDETSHSGLVRHLMIRTGYKTGEIMVCLVINGDTMPESEELVSLLKTIPEVKSIFLNINTDDTNAILGNKSVLLWGEKCIKDSVCGLLFEISLFSFFQVNPSQMEILYETALDFSELKGEERVLDVYCGIGTLSLLFARKAKRVIGIEISAEAIKDAEKNAKANGIDNAEFIEGAAEKVMPKLAADGIMPDIIVIDPPRKGCELPVLDAIADMNPEKIIYVSCDPATMSRDIKYISEKGYKFVMAKPVDQFCHTVHVEVVTLLQKV